MRVVVSCACGRFKPKALPIRRFAELTAAAGPARLAQPAERLPADLIRGACPWRRRRAWRFAVVTPPRPAPLAPTAKAPARPPEQAPEGETD